ncbi:hypothetical protein BHU72_01350 [Desulfuribacillus stibiiarsenatis]|uniref:Uncharacterized protein n=1 Tax=Desulfuribacillus stibiiarsenatis TaxID=1390249 RepID=A0A1E5LA42_9FIRM|nr:hypothetical protein [Desulfuribacillus stibiiarsenatis]OEH86934.1 hypothetical protein BHU72_01350 [Desulfuribacillus stibiiarsenatis]
MNDLEVLNEILAAFESGKNIRTCIQFGTVQGCFVVETIEQKEHANQWIFRGGTFMLSTGRYQFLRKVEEGNLVRYIFAPKLEAHPKKLIAFEIS